MSIYVVSMGAPGQYFEKMSFSEHLVLAFLINFLWILYYMVNDWSYNKYK